MRYRLYYRSIARWFVMCLQSFQVYVLAWKFICALVIFIGPDIILLYLCCICLSIGLACADIWLQMMINNYMYKTRRCDCLKFCVLLSAFWYHLALIANASHQPKSPRSDRKWPAYSDRPRFQHTGVMQQSAIRRVNLIKNYRGPETNCNRKFLCCT